MLVEATRVCAESRWGRAHVKASGSSSPTVFRFLAYRMNTSTLMYNIVKAALYSTIKPTSVTSASR